MTVFLPLLSVPRPAGEEASKVGTLDDR
jgi:hypothetical protein